MMMIVNQSNINTNNAHSRRSCSFKSILEDMNRQEELVDANNCTVAKSSSAASTQHTVKMETAAFKAFASTRRAGSFERQSSNSKKNYDERRHKANHVTHSNQSHSRRDSPSNSNISSFYQDLTTRTEHHIASFPSNPNANNYSKLLSKWHGTTLELVMKWTTLWGKKRQHAVCNNNGDTVSSLQFAKGVMLADQLMDKLFSVIERQLEQLVKIHSSEFDVATGTTDANATAASNANTSQQSSSSQPSSIDPSFKSRHNNRQQGKVLDVEICCCSVALGWSRCDAQTSTTHNAAQKAQTLLHRLENICHTYDHRLPLRIQRMQPMHIHRREFTPTLRMYNHVLTCWSRSSDADAERCARELLNRMCSSSGSSSGCEDDNDTSESKEHKYCYASPDIISYNNMLQVYANRGDVENAQALLCLMEKSGSNNGTSTDATGSNDISSNSSISQSSSSSSLAQHKLPKHNIMAPDVFSYSIVMNAIRNRFLKYHDRNDPRLAEQMLTDMINQGRVMPNEVCFSIVLTMYANADRIVRDGGADIGRKWQNRTSRNGSNGTNRSSNNGRWGSENAQRVLAWMIDLYERQDGVPRGSPNGNTIQLNSQHFMTVIDAIAKSGRGKEGAMQCQELCDRLVSFYETSGSDHLRPRPECFGAVINAWSKADQEYTSAEHAEAVLDQMENYFLNEQKDKRFMLSNVAYNLVADAWSRRSGKDTAECAERILNRMILNYQSTKNKSIRPDVISFTSVIKAFVDHPDGGNKALEMLNEMNKQVQQGNVKAQPDAKTIAIAMDACAKSGLIDDASRLLDDVKDGDKNRVMFNTLISACKLQGRGDRAEELLRKMIDLSNKGFKKCSPDATTYSLCVFAWGATMDVTSQQRLDNAIAVFDECIQCYINDNNNLLKPSTTHFNTLAHVMASSDNPDKEYLILSLFERMEKVDCAPCIVSFNILIKACAGIDGTKERRAKSLQVAASAFNSIESAGLKADSITYTSMIHAILNLCDDIHDRTNALSGVFQRCCEDGCLNQHILNTLIEESTEEEFSIITRGLVGYEQSIGIQSLPSQWSSRAQSVAQ